MNVSMKSLFAVPLLALGIACAHESTSTTTARVRTLAAGGARDASALQPAAGAGVALTCPDGVSKEMGKTDASGELRAEQTGALPLDCSLVVKQQGFRSETVRVSDVCMQLGYGGCERADVRTVLAPATTGSAGDVK